MFLVRNITIVLSLALLAGPAYSEDPPGWEEAHAALTALGADLPGSTGRCATCHALSSATLTKWGDEAQNLYWTCLKGHVPYDSVNEPSVPAGEAVNCMRETPADPNSRFSLTKLGVYSGASHLEDFKNLFRRAFGEETWEAEYNSFNMQVRMPINGENSMSETEFASVVGWVRNDMPHLRRILGELPPPPTTCEPSITEDFLQHLAKMKTEGWEVKNQEAGMRYYGCSPGQAKTECFAQRDALGRDLFPVVSSLEMGREWAAPFPGTKIRIVRHIGYQTSFWMRTSADGRFVANGYEGSFGDDWDDSDQGSYGARITDLNSVLVEGAPYRDIKVDSYYDPSFFPDGSGFMFQGSGTGMCNMSILLDPTTTKIDFSEPQCNKDNSVALYQAVGTSLDGMDYIAVAGDFASDGGDGMREDGLPYWMESSRLTFTTMAHDGQVYQTVGESRMETPYLGDWNVSPSTRLVIGRMGGEDASLDPIHLGFKIFFADQVVDDDGAYNYNLREAATLCHKGLKGKFSYDENWFVTYHYVDAGDFADFGYATPEDPGFQALLAQGSANIYLFNLKTGENKRLTNMGPGQFALFPHFRGDGWIYFMALDKASGRRYIAVADGALVAESQLADPVAN